MVRRPREHDSGDDAVGPIEAVAGLFGLLPHWAKDARLARNTFNARNTSRHWMLPLPSQMELSGACRYRRGRIDSST